MKNPEHRLSPDKKDSPLFRYIKEGRFDFATLPKEELSSVVTEYQEKFSELRKPNRAEIMEQFLRLRAIDEAVARNLVHHMTVEEQAEIGEYIGNVLRPEMYVALFQDTWSSMPHDMRDFFVQTFTIENPEHALMVAPFVDLTEYRTDDEKKKKPVFYKIWSRDYSYIRFDPPSILDVYFHTQESAAPLVEHCLEHGSHEVLQRIFQHYRVRAPHFLFPYLRRLCEAEVMSETEAHELVSSTDFKEVKKFYLATDEKENLSLIKTIERSAADHNALNVDHLYQPTGFPPYAVREYNRIKSNVLKRMVAHIFKDFSFLETLLSPEEKQQLLIKIMGNQIPIFAAHTELHVSPEELETLITELEDKQGEKFPLLPDCGDIPILKAAGLEPVIVSVLLKEFAWTNSSRAEHLIEKEAFALFSDEQKKMLLQQIEKSPLWLCNPAYAEREGINLSELLKFAIADSWIFFERFPSIYYWTLAQERAGASVPMESKKLIAYARKIFQKEPSEIFSHWTVFRLTYREGAKAFILQNSSEQRFVIEFFHQLRKEAVPHDMNVLLRACKNEVGRRMERNPNLAGAVLSEVWESWGEFQSLYSLKRRVELLCQILEAGITSNLFGNQADFIAKDLAAYPSAEFRVLEILKEKKAARALAVVILQNEKVIQQYEETIKKSAKAWGQKKRKRQTADTNAKKPISKEQIAVLYDMNDDAKKELVRLCKAEKFLAFDQAILPLAIPELDRIRDEELDEFLWFFPEKLEHVAKHKSIPLSLFMKHIRALALLRTAHRGALYRFCSLNETRLEKIKEINPLAALEQEESLPEDYYACAIRILQKQPFFPLYAETLGATARDEFEKNGPQQDMRYFSPQREFSALASQILALGSSHDACAMKEEILGLPSDKKRIAIPLLEFILLHSLDTRPPENRKKFRDALSRIGADYETAEKRLSDIAFGYARSLFGIEENADIDSVHRMSPALIRIFSIYFSTSCKGEKPMEEAVRTLVRRTLAGSMFPWRTWGTEEEPASLAAKIAAVEQMKKQGLLPSAVSAEQYETWVSDAERPFDAMLHVNETDVRFGIKNIFLQAVADGHIRDEELTPLLDLSRARAEYRAGFELISTWSRRLDLLRAKLENPKTGGEKLSEEEAKEYRELQKRIGAYMKENKDSLEQAEARVYLAKLPHISLKELEREMLEIEGKQISLQKAFQVLERVWDGKNGDFLFDIRTIQTLLHETRTAVFGGTKISKSFLQITDVFDLETYMKIGDEPTESCQNYHSGSRMNWGLLSYVLDPNVKIIQVYNEKRRIIARAVLRLLEDDNGKPQLFLERMYSANPHPKIHEAITAFAREKAKSMNIGIFEYPTEEESVHDGRTATLASRGSRAPYVYTDAGGGRTRGGMFAIRNARATP